ncbi:MAG: hypothetical protein QOF77_1632 [Solirubrobacteraceae bacterium]|nr:hypothetical protein [Solirubrobacteraceae bacterium]
MTQYLLPEGLGLDAALDRLAGRWALGVGPVEVIERTFYDTFDGRLHRAGLALIGAGGRLVAARGPGYHEVAAAPVIPGERLFAPELPDGSLRRLLEPIVEIRALGPIICTRGQVRGLRVLNRDAKTVVRLVLETASSGEEVVLRSRLRVIGVRGYDRALARVERALAEDLGFAPSPVALHDDALRAAGRAPGGVSTKLAVKLAADDPARAGAAVVLVALLRTIELTLPGTVADIDSEFLHDLRVAVRRTRSIQRQLAGVFPAGRLARFRSEFRWLGQVTGPTRDLDVLLLDFARLRAELADDRAAELAPLGDLLGARRELERRRMVAALAGERTGSLLAGWSSFLTLAQAPDGGGADGAPLGAVVGQRIRALYRQMRRAGVTIDEGTPAERLHDLRKQGKELRYLLEIFAGLYPAEAVAPTVKTLKALQETLGQFQDREVQATTLRSLGDDLAQAAGGPAALLALGVVLERVEADSRAARVEFDERFAAYAAPSQRALVRRAFR